MAKHYDELPLVYPEMIEENSSDKFIGNGWDVSRENGKYYFSYISGEMQGKEKSIEINKEDFNAVKDGSVAFDEICRKYGVSQTADEHINTTIIATLAANQIHESNNRQRAPAPESTYR